MEDDIAKSFAETRALCSSSASSCTESRARIQNANRLLDSSAARLDRCAARLSAKRLAAGEAPCP